MCVVLALMLLVSVAACGESPEQAQDAERGARHPPAPLLGITWKPPKEWSSRGGTLAPLDPRTLEPRSSPTLKLGPHGYSLALSPDGSKLAIGGFGARLAIVDAGTLARAVNVRLRPRHGLVHALSWTGARRLVAVVARPTQHGSDDLSVAVVDAATGTTTRLEAVAGPLEVHQVEAAGAWGLVVLVAPAGRVGLARLVLTGPDGRVRVANLPVAAGSEPPRTGTDGRFISPGRLVLPGLAVDPIAGIAYVVAAGSTVAAVDLEAATTSLHRIHKRKSVAERLLDWIEGDALAKGDVGPRREAAWLGDDAIAVTGYDLSPDWQTRPAGLHLIDTETWTTTELDERVSTLAAGQDVVVGFGGTPEGFVPGPGVVAFSPEGRPLWRRQGGRNIFRVQLAGRRVYAEVPSRPSNLGVALDLTTGRKIGTVRTPLPRLLAVERLPTETKESVGVSRDSGPARGRLLGAAT